MSKIIEINGLPLPSALVAAMVNGTWRATRSLKPWYQLFPRSDVVRPKLYNADHMQDVNADWLRESREIYLGQADGRCQPGRLDPMRSLLIGELEPDALIALDYQNAMDSPSVVYLTCDDDSNRWVRVAPNVESLMQALSRMED
jgi:hypothetical protein